MTSTLPLLAAALLAQPGAVLTLDEALRTAEQRNLDLVAARARLDEAQQLSRKAWSGYLPQVSASGTYTYNSTEAKFSLPTGYNVRDVGAPVGPGPNDPAQPTSPENPPGNPTPYVLFPAGFAEAVIQPRHSLSGSVQASQALVVPALWANIRNAYLAEKTAELSTESARREILFAVVQLYYGAEGLRESAEVQERLLEVNREHEKDAQLGFKVGTAPEIALLRAQIERTRAEQDLLRTKNAYRSAIKALATLLDVPAEFEVTRPPEPERVAGRDDLAKTAVAERPDLLAARKNLELSRGGKRAVWAQYAPSLAAFLRYSVMNAKGFTGEYDTWNAGLALNWTLWDGGLRESALREASARIAAAEASARAAENRARDELERAVLDLESAEANRVKAQEQVKLAQRNAQLLKVSFEAGSSTSLEVVDANAALRASELTLINEQLNAQLAAVRVAKAAGLFDPKTSGDSAGRQPPGGTEKP